MYDRNILKSNLLVVMRVVDYFAAELVNNEYFDYIKQNAIKHSNKFLSPNGETFINLGFLSPMECTLYLCDSGVEDAGRVIDEAIKALEENLIIYRIDKMISYRMTDERYRINGQYAMYYYNNNLILNLILGFEFIAQFYKKSVVKIENVSENNDRSIGTGFLIDYKGNHLLITNKHVVEKSVRINIFGYDDETINFETPFVHPSKDIAIIALIDKSSFPAFVLNHSIKVLDEIITIGYPSIPMTKLAYQVYHKGEVNSFVEDYYNNKLFLISAKTSAGNSGSPVIDRSGTVIGIVTEELFEKEQFYEKGKLPYYAAIAANDILEIIELYESGIIMT